ncbi:RNA-binding protein 1-like [Salvia hispanica]|uniref:RNA-binding protein 1-like n=1 Tax=Salvia hispanica TaxID=49212 RepID=UPI0020094B28|nr:RNA-binding protein 1-like [Salvia hispanica]XP_047971397.1 RNA-binding protein 1-like [Salvia hispanica]
MADAFWRYGDNRQPAVSLPAQMAAKRTRSEFEMPSGQDTSSYYTPGNERPGNVVSRDTDSVNASYERYLRSLQVPSYGGQTGRPGTGGLDGVHEIDDLRVLGMVQSGPAAAPQSRLMGVGGRPEISLPPDASSTLFVEGLPANCTRREVSHIFRPFVGYKEVRLVNKAPRNPGGDPVVLCFVDFESPAHAATAMDALQGYIFDEHERDSGHLRVQFARNPPGPRLGGGHRGNR